MLLQFHSFSFFINIEQCSFGGKTFSALPQSLCFCLWFSLLSLMRPWGHWVLQSQNMVQQWCHFRILRFHLQLPMLAPTSQVHQIMGIVTSIISCWPAGVISIYDITLILVARKTTPYMLFQMFILFSL